MTVRNLIPLIKCNDVILMCGEDEICLIRKDYVEDILSEKYLDMKVDYIENDEAILDTIVVHVLKKDVTFYADGKEVEEE